MQFQLLPEDRDAIEAARQRSAAQRTRSAATTGAWRRFAAMVRGAGLSSPCRRPPEVVAAYLAVLWGGRVRSLGHHQASTGPPWSTRHKSGNGLPHPADSEVVRTVVMSEACRGPWAASRSRLQAAGRGRLRGDTPDGRDTQAHARRRPRGSWTTRLERGAQDIAIISVMRERPAASGRGGRLGLDRRAPPARRQVAGSTSAAARPTSGPRGPCSTWAAKPWSDLEVKVRPGEEGVQAVFTGRDGRRLSAKCTSPPGSKMRAKEAGLGDGYSGHSPRIGMAIDLAADGSGLPALQQAGRWTGNDDAGAGTSGARTVGPGSGGPLRRQEGIRGRKRLSVRLSLAEWDISKFL